MPVIVPGILFFGKTSLYTQFGMASDLEGVGKLTLGIMFCRLVAMNYPFFPKSNDMKADPKYTTIAAPIRTIPIVLVFLSVIRLFPNVTVVQSDAIR